MMTYQDAMYKSKKDGKLYTFYQMKKMKGHEFEVIPHEEGEKG